jgi:hypothetical protein
VRNSAVCFVAGEGLFVASSFSIIKILLPVMMTEVINGVVHVHMTYVLALNQRISALPMPPIQITGN